MSKETVVKNGTRKKVLRDGIRMEVFEIQRMKAGYSFYFDFFPLFLIPNSVSLFENITEYKNGVYTFITSSRKNCFMKWMEKEKLDFLSLEGFLFLEKTSSNLSLYRSYRKVSPCFLFKGKRKNVAPKYVFLVIPFHQHI